MSDFDGRPISGDVSHYADGPVAQEDPQLFLDALDALLAVPGVEAVKWNQYTPYFNDGEACTFRIYSAYVKIAGDDDEVGDYGDGFRSSYDLYEYGPGGYTDKKFLTIGNTDGKVLHDVIRAFEAKLEGGQHFGILSDKFGDPATVTATTDGFSVEFYDHD